MELVNETFEMSETSNSVYAAKVGSIRRSKIDGAKELVDSMMEHVEVQVIRVSVPTRGPGAGLLRIVAYTLSGRFLKSKSPKDEASFLSSFRDCFFSQHSERDDAEAVSETLEGVSKDLSGRVSGIRVPDGHVGWFRFTEGVKAE